MIFFSIHTIYKYKIKNKQNVKKKAEKLKKKVNVLDLYRI